MEDQLTAYINATVYTPQGVLQEGRMIVNQAGAIVAVGDIELALPDGVDIVDLTGCTVLPGFIDVHVHGGGGHQMMDGTYEGLDGMSRYHAAHGTTSFLATTGTDAQDRLCRALANAAAGINQGVSGAEVLGIHLEGPYIDFKRSGAQKRDYIRLPQRDELALFLAAAEDHIKLVTLAPEVEGGMETVRWLIERGITVSIGHSNATYEEVCEAVALGARHTTHHFNGMSPFHHREPGVAGAGLMLPQLTTELIADGIHVHPAAAKFLFQTKGAANVCMITDAVRCAGMPDGIYGHVKVENGTVTLLDGSSLAGSTLTTIQAFRNMLEFTGLPPEAILPSLTEVPARQIGVSERKGSIAPGKDADFLVTDARWDIHSTFVKGKKVYGR
ncbi:N-acetylglucosamine-6-phosphate deacetylase [Paenibacillus aestuarii]|uniref:N-acetylglucosamine-6-phosphate deacetylase n=1 Tax=Paenibacillus aestuarii TaxID=516965 RepID=A0ABW0KHE5_9BACL|nr:N-acetylglucosamine-6-phosphate deacetylase [Paenibacillus aestuarii]